MAFVTLEQLSNNLNTFLTNIKNYLDSAIQDIEDSAVPGVGINSIVYDSVDGNGNYIYRINLTDNSHYNITVPKGNKGDAFTYGDFTSAQLEMFENGGILGKYNTLAELQAAHPTGTLGDTYYVLDTHQIYIWDVTNGWTGIGTIRGEQGERGEAGLGIQSIEVTDDYKLKVTYTDDTVFISNQSIRGAQGSPGATGATGKGISSVVLNPNYTLTFNYTDGTNSTTSSVRGETGATGATGNGISSTELNNDYTLTINFTDGTSYTTPSIRGASGSGRSTWYGTCSTAASTAQKDVVCSGFELTAGNIIGVLFSTANTYGTPTLNVNSTAAKSIYVGTALPASTTNVLKWSANTLVFFMYDGSQYRYITSIASSTTVPPRGANTWYGTSSTTATTAAKTSTIDNFVLTKGAVVYITFSTANTYTNGKMTLNINSTGAKDVFYNNAVTSSTNTLTWNAGETLTFVYSGSYYYFVSRATSEDGLPSQSGHSGKFLTTDGTTASWATVSAGGGGTVTSVGVNNATDGGLTVSGSPVISSGTIVVGHSNVLTNAQTTQAVYPITIDKNGHISAYGSAVTIPDVSGKIDTAGTGLSKSGTTLNHSNSVTAQTTQAVYPIKIDAEGHISDYGSAVSIIPTNHATVSTTYGVGDSSFYGHVKLTDNISTSASGGGYAATPAAVKTAYDLASGKYSLPSGGIPKTDLASAVQTSLDSIPNIVVSSTPLTPGVSQLTNGTIYLYYEV